MNLYNFGEAGKDGLYRATWDPKHSNFVMHIWQEGKATPIATCRERTQEDCEKAACRVKAALEMQARFEAPEFRDRLKESVEGTLRTRLRSVHGLDPFASRRNKRSCELEVEFLVGAMTTMNVAFPGVADALSDLVPPYWVMCMMSNRSVLEKPKAK